MNVRIGLFQSLSTNKNKSPIILLPFILLIFSPDRIQKPIPKLDFLIRYSFFRQKQFDGLKNCETLEFVVSELVVGSDEKDNYLFSVSSLFFSCSSGLSDFEVTCAWVLRSCVISPTSFLTRSTKKRFYVNITFCNLAILGPFFKFVFNGM